MTRSHAVAHRTRLAGWLLAFVALVSMHLQVWSHSMPAGSGVEALCSALPAGGDSDPVIAHHGADCVLCSLSAFDAPLASPDRQTATGVVVVSAVSVARGTGDGHRPCPWSPARPRAPPASMTV